MQMETETSEKIEAQVWLLNKKRKKEAEKARDKHQELWWWKANWAW